MPNEKYFENYKCNKNNWFSCVNGVRCWLNGFFYISQFFWQGYYNNNVKKNFKPPFACIFPMSNVLYIQRNVTPRSLPIFSLKIWSDLFIHVCFKQGRGIPRTAWAPLSWLLKYHKYTGHLYFPTFSNVILVHVQENITDELKVFEKRHEEISQVKMFNPNL